MLGQNAIPTKGIFYYSDGCHTIEIEFFERNTMCIINTVCDVAMYSADCGTYTVKGDTLIFTSDSDTFLSTQLKIDTTECKWGEVAIQLKTISPLEQPEWSEIITLESSFTREARDSLQLLDVMSWSGMSNNFSWSAVSEFDTLKFDKLGIIKGPFIKIPAAQCMNVEYPFLWKMSIQDSGYSMFVFSEIGKKHAYISINGGNKNTTMKFKYVLRDPFNP